MKKIIVFLLCVLFLVVHTKKSNFQILYADECHKEKNHTAKIFIKKKEDNGVDYYDVRFTIYKDLDNNNKGTAELYTYMGNKRRKALTTNIKGLCKFVLDCLGKLYIEMVRRVNMPHPERCPIEKGDYHINWTTIDFNDAPVITLIPRGKFEVIIALHPLDSQVENICVQAAIEKK